MKRLLLGMDFTLLTLASIAFYRYGYVVRWAGKVVNKAIKKRKFLNSLAV